MVDQTEIDKAQAVIKQPYYEESYANTLQRLRQIDR
jgi:hypothetical protein